MKHRRRLHVNYSSNYVKVLKTLTIFSNSKIAFHGWFWLVSIFLVRRKTNVKYFYNPDLNLVYLTVSNADGAVECFYLASSSSATLDLTATETIRAKLIAAHAHECHDVDKVQLMLAIIDPNTTIVYYKLTLGLVSLASLKEERTLSQPKVCDSDQAQSSGASASAIVWIAFRMR